MGKLALYVIHCTDTPESMNVTKAMIEQWHMSPCDNNDGTVTYLGQKYASRESLPNQFINGQAIKKLHGRGWNRRGYTDMFTRSGQMVSITPNDNNDIITDSEMTWGATGVNAVSIHKVLAGGWVRGQRTGTFNFLEVFTLAQRMALEADIKKNIELHPHIKIAGHRDIPGAGKTCPNFDVKEFLKSIKLEEYYYESKNR